MAYHINENCTCCGACVEVCPSDAISQGDGTYTIDVETCEECGSCVEVCFLEAIEER